MYRAGHLALLLHPGHLCHRQVYLLLLRYPKTISSSICRCINRVLVLFCVPHIEEGNNWSPHPFLGSILAQPFYLVFCQVSKKMDPIRPIIIVVPISELLVQYQPGVKSTTAAGLPVDKQPWPALFPSFSYRWQAVLSPLVQRHFSVFYSLSRERGLLASFVCCYSSSWHSSLPVRGVKSSSTVLPSPSAMSLWTPG